MIISIEKLEQEINKYFDDEDSIVGTIKVCEDIINSKSIDDACKEIKNLRQVFKNTTELPVWFRYLVFLTIYTQNRGSFTQSDLLKAMGLSPDIFTKHWKMYAPSFALKQDKNEEIDLNFATNTRKLRRNKYL